MTVCWQQADVSSQQSQARKRGFETWEVMTWGPRRHNLSWSPYREAHSRNLKLPFLKPPPNGQLHFIKYLEKFRPSRSAAWSQPLNPQADTSQLLIHVQCASHFIYSQYCIYGVQTCPRTHPASCTMATGSFPGVKCSRGMLLTTHPLLVPLSLAIPLPTLWATPGL